MQALAQSPLLGLPAGDVEDGEGNILLWGRNHVPLPRYNCFPQRGHLFTHGVAERMTTRKPGLREHSGREAMPDY